MAHRIDPLLTQRSRQMRREPTDAERLIWQRLRAKQLGVRFRRQHVLGRYIVDFACLEAGLIVELDGGQHAELLENDRQRTAWLEGQGFRVLRFWNNEVLTETQLVLERIHEALEVRTLPLAGGGQGGGGQS